MTALPVSLLCVSCSLTYHPHYSTHRVLDRALLRNRPHRALPLPPRLLQPRLIRRHRRLGPPAAPEPAERRRSAVRARRRRRAHRAVHAAGVVHRPARQARDGRLGHARGLWHRGAGVCVCTGGGGVVSGAEGGGTARGCGRGDGDSHARGSDWECVRAVRQTRMSRLECRDGQRVTGLF